MLSVWLRKQGKIQRLEQERKTKARTRKEAKRKRLVEEKKKRKKLEYIQQLQDKMIAENTTLLEGANESQIAKSKYKEVTSEDKEG